MNFIWFRNASDMEDYTNRTKEVAKAEHRLKWLKIHIAVILIEMVILGVVLGYALFSPSREFTFIFLGMAIAGLWASLDRLLEAKYKP